MTAANGVRPIVVLNIDCLSVREHTGIANLAKAMALEMLDDETIEAKFFMMRGEVPRGIVERLVRLDGGDILWWLAARLDGRPTFVSEPGRPLVGIYTHFKSYRRLFPIEVQIVHDLTIVVTPQFHTAETVRGALACMLGDMLTSDLLVARSEATLMDIRTYFPQVADIPCIVARGAPEAGEVRPLPPGRKPVDYVLVLGTLEPRKNVRFILECLARHPEILAETKFVFVGRWGWGASTLEVIESFGLAEQVANGRIVFTGFVSDEARDQLVAAARLVVYISRYEGLGLPVIEALRFGTPVITSYSSSLPEVGGDLAHYCDIDSPSSFHAALTRILSDERSDQARQSRIAWAGEFAIKDSYRRIRDAALAATQVK
jgi:glycosyltransferase involved in cell wall biosynthesis